MLGDKLFGVLMTFAGSAWNQPCRPAGLKLSALGKKLSPG